MLPAVGPRGCVSGVCGGRRTYIRTAPPSGSSRMIDNFEARFTRFLTNEWVHLETKVATLQAEMRLVLAMLSVMVGLILFLVVNSIV